MRNRGLLIGAMMASVSALPAWAQAGGASGQSAPAAQDAQDSDAGDAGTDGGEIVVQAQKLPGSVVGDIPPEQTLGPADIRSYGVSTISDLLTELSPQTTSGRGDGGVVVLLNGRRIANFSEIQDLPTEAIQRTEIFPEEVALKYGYSADQRVVNIVLRNRFRSITTQAAVQAPTEGGTLTPRGELGVYRIAGANRMTLAVNYDQTSKLNEDERGLIGQAGRGSFDLVGNITPAAGSADIDPALSAAAGRPVSIAGVPVSGANTLGGYVAGAGTPNVTDLTPYRSLIPASQNLTANLNYSRPLGTILANFNATMTAQNSQSDQGLAGVSPVLPAGNPFSPFGGPVTLNRYVDGAVLGQSRDTLRNHAGLTLNSGNGGKWRWTVTATYDRIASDTFTDVGVDASRLQAGLNANSPAVNPFGPLGPDLIAPGIGNIARSVNQTEELNALVNGSPFRLPAGDVSTTIRVGYSNEQQDSRATRLGVVTAANTSQSVVSGQINVDVPITSRTRDVLPWFGNFSLNGNYAVRHLNYYGTLNTIGYGFNWSPIVPLRVIVSFTDQDQAPSANNLADPQVVTPNTLVFDYVRGVTASVTRITGGNPLLSPSNRHQFKAGFSLTPLPKSDFRLQADYTRQSTDNPIRSFPEPTAAVEAAFPQRFVRDAAGNLLSVDARQLNFQSQTASQLRWGFSVSQSIKSRTQKQIEAYRAGTGPNPFAGMSFGGRRGAPGGGQASRNEQPGSGDQGGAPPSAGNPSQGAAREFGGGQGRGGGGFGRGGGFGGRGGAGGGGRLRFSFFHTWQFENRLVIRDGVPVLDYLDGAAFGSTGGASRHKLELQAGYSNNGLGFRLNGTYNSGTRVDGGTLAAPNTLYFGRLSTFNFGIWQETAGNLSLLRKYPWARGMRVSFDVRNILNTRQDVRDAAGVRPISYQPGSIYNDALGRTVRLTIRKQFF